ncbi:MarR family winged helix-turn-helix transcriptional regulator [Oryzobacter telluris]|uniref:MarR family winged helix-turn-helix transcriptional regulator n=1 Tax=Oryzobacter telluris TaxID=3149179 RepID=UPI00370D798D
MPSLAHELHLLVALMDRAADGLLARHDVGLTYKRFLVLLHVSDADGPTQRDLADRLGSSEAATSRMVAGLARDGLLDIGRGAGNRRELRITAVGGERLAAAGHVLGDHFDALVTSQGVDPTDLTTTVRRLAAALREG